jgi:hypothetical protein
MAQIILDSNNNLIQGDFDNATLNNRTKLQTTTTNATTNVYIAPNGSSTSAGVSVANNSDLTNASKIVMATNGSTDTQIISGVNGSGTYLPLSFYTNNALGMQLSTAGNLTVTGTVTQSGAPAFSVTKSSGQSITGSVTTKVTFDTETFDTNNNFASSTFTPTVAGYYQLNVNLNFGTTGTGQVNLFKNGSLLFNGIAVTYNSSVGGIMPLSCMTYMNGSTDYIEVYTYITASVTINSGAQNTQFSGFLARSA